MAAKKKALGINSICAHTHPWVQTTRPVQLPIYPSATFAFESLEQGAAIFKGEIKGDVYTRYSNPTITSVENKLAALEAFGAEAEASALLFSSGMGAISALLMALITPGDEILTQGNLYGGTTEFMSHILAPLGVKPVFIDLQNLELVAETLKNNKAIKVLYCETPANPTLACVDLEELAKLARQYGVKTVVDNTFASPYLQRPLGLGFDFVVHSTTKYLNGHSSSVGGAVVSFDTEFMAEKVWKQRKLFGASTSAFDAWLVHYGMKTLSVRMDRQCANSHQIAQFLESHPKVARVNYPGLASHPDHAIAKKQMSDFGAMISFELAGGLDAGIRFMNAIRTCTLGPSLGDVDTLVLHPASMSHVNIDKALRLENGITDGLVRLSVGIEDVQDLIADLEQAMA